MPLAVRYPSQSRPARPLSRSLLETCAAVAPRRTLSLALSLPPAGRLPCASLGTWARQECATALPPFRAVASAWALFLISIRLSPLSIGLAASRLTAADRIRIAAYRQHHLGLVPAGRRLEATPCRIVASVTREVTARAVVNTPASLYPLPLPTPLPLPLHARSHRVPPLGKKPYTLRRGHRSHRRQDVS